MSMQLPTELDPGFRSPPKAGGLLATSHIHRSNFNRGDPANEANNRVFRQGYEFLEGQVGEPGISAGLNFVSFQRSIERLQRILRIPAWLGSANFGGSIGTVPQPALMSLLAGGFYAVPPLDDPFPGHGIFTG